MDAVVAEVWPISPMQSDQDARLYSFILQANSFDGNMEGSCYVRLTVCQGKGQLWLGTFDLLLLEGEGVDR